MVDLNIERKLVQYWQKAHDAASMRDFKALQSAYWGLYHLNKDFINEHKQLPTIKA